MLRSEDQREVEHATFSYMYYPGFVSYWTQANAGGCFQCKPPVIQDQLTLKRNHQPVVKNADHHLLSLCSAISGVLEEPGRPTDMHAINTPQVMWPPLRLNATKLVTHSLIIVSIKAWHKFQIFLPALFT